MRSARPVTADSGMPPAIPFARVTRSGTTPSCSLANHAPVRAKPVCTSSAMKTTPFSFAHATSVGRNPGAGTMNPPSPWMGSMMIAATESAPICFSICVIAPERRLLAREAGLVAVRVGRGHAVHLGRERTEVRLVRHRLRRECHREVGSTVISVVERDHRCPAGCESSDLDCVLDSLRTGVEQHRTLLVVSRRQCGEFARRPGRTPRRGSP